MTADLDRKIVTVRYNLLNLPDTIQYYDGSMTVSHYLADGTRLSSVHHTVLDGVVVPVGSVCNVDTIANVTTSGSAYCQNIEYEMQADGTPAISRVFNSEGFIAGILPTAQAAYYCRDAQGNITSVWRVDAGYPYQTTHYYADGHIKNNSTGTSFQPYLYSGKELVKMHGYDCYDYGARHSYTALGRFTTIDPLAEKYYDTSPYVLCGGNPVRYVDLDGREIKTLFKNPSDIAVANQYPDDKKAKILFAHGVSNNKGVVDNRTKNKRAIDSGAELKEIVNTEFSQSSDGESNTTTILISCNAANEENGIAQELSVEMPEEVVVGATDKVQQKDGKVKVLNGGDWLILKNGLEVDRYNGKWQPKSAPTKLDYLLYNKKDSFSKRVQNIIQGNK